MKMLDYIYPVENDRESLNAELDALSAAGMTQAQVRHVEYFFKQAATQKIAYGLILFSQRKKMHRQVAEWIEVNSQHVSDRYPDLALHWQRADEPKKAIKYLELAAEEAHAIFANRETLNYLLQLEALLEDKQISIPSITRARWKEMSGAARLKLGYLEEAEQDFRQALSFLGIQLPKTSVGFVVQTMVQIVKQIRHRYIPSLNRTVAAEKVAETHLAARLMERHFVLYYYLENVVGLFMTSFAATNLSESTADNAETLSKSYSNLASALSGIPLFGLSAMYFSRAKAAANVANEPGTWAWYYLASGMSKAATGDWVGHDNAMLKSQHVAKEQGDRKRWEESAAVYCIGGLTYGNFYSVTDNGHIYQKIYESGYSRGVYQSQSWGYCMWTMSAIMQGQYKIAKEVMPKLEKLYLDHPEGFDPVNVLEAATSFSLLAIRARNRARAIQYLEVGANVVDNWGRPTTWRSIPCCYAQAEACLRFWYQEKTAQQSNDESRFEDWVKASIKNINAHASIYQIAVSRLALLNGWYRLMSGNPRAAAQHWQKGLRYANQFNMKFDILAITLAASNLDDNLTQKLNLLSASELKNLAAELNVSDAEWFRDWRLVA